MTRPTIPNADTRFTDWLVTLHAAWPAPEGVYWISMPVIGWRHTGHECEPVTPRGYDFAVVEMCGKFHIWRGYWDEVCDTREATEEFAAAYYEEEELKSRRAAK